MMRIRCLMKALTVPALIAGLLVIAEAPLASAQQQPGSAPGGERPAPTQTGKFDWGADTIRTFELNCRLPGGDMFCAALPGARAGRDPGEVWKEVYQTFCSKGDKKACELLYCNPDPSSKQCLEAMGRASGPGWYERHRDYSGGTVYVDIVCTEIPPFDGGYNYRSRRLFCSADTGRCQYHSREDSRLTPELPSLQAAARDVCDHQVARYRRWRAEYGSKR